MAIPRAMIRHIRNTSWVTPTAWSKPGCTYQLTRANAGIFCATCRRKKSRNCRLRLKKKFRWLRGVWGCKETNMAIKLHYIGRGDAIIHVPARDLTDEDFAERADLWKEHGLDEAGMIASGLYQK